MLFILWFAVAASMLPHALRSAVIQLSECVLYLSEPKAKAPLPIDPPLTQRYRQLPSPDNFVVGGPLYATTERSASPDSMLDVPPKRSKRLRRARRRFFFYLAYVLLFHPPLYPFAALAQLPAS